MRKVIVPALLAIAFLACTSSNASAFGHLSHLFGHNNCDACCDVEPVCGCEAPAPVCGCETAAPCCGPKHGLLHKLFHKNNACCDTGCAAPAPACGCEVIEPVCGCEAPVAGCCDSGCCGNGCGLKHHIGGFFNKLFHKNNACCDSGCAAPACGCEVIEPACGCEPSCGFGL